MFDNWKTFTFQTESGEKISDALYRKVIPAFLSRDFVKVIRAHILIKLNFRFLYADNLVSRSFADDNVLGRDSRRLLRDGATAITAWIGRLRSGEHHGVSLQIQGLTQACVQASCI